MADEKRYEDRENVPMTEKEIKQMIRSEQNRAYDSFEEESWDLAGITSEEFKKHMESYDEEDDLHKYLVNGAKLTCTQVTYEPFKIPEVGDFGVEEISDMTKHLYTELNVSENPMGINGQPYATVNDTVQGINILPFTGNCRVPANGSEKETIMIQLEYGIRRDGTWKQPGVKGVCECLMQLNEQWDNMFLADGGDYCINRVDIDTEGKRKSAKGITRTSVLFCKHGGLIVPVTSGQDVVELEQKFNLESPDFSDQEAVKEYIWNYFRNANFSEAATAAILGNIYVETGGYRPDINDKDRYGLFQYMNKRKDIFLDRVNEWAVAEGITDVQNAWKDVEMQCRFALEEIENPGDYGWLDRGIYLTINGRSFDMLCTSDKFRTEDDPTVAALMWAASFERCYSGDIIKKDGNIYFTELQHQEERCNEAVRVFEEFTEHSNN